MMRKSVYVVVICVWFLSCASTPSKQKPERAEGADDDIVAIEWKDGFTLEKKVDRLFDRAYEDYLEGDYENAIIGFESAGLLNSKKMEYWRKSALIYCYLATGRYKNAENLSEKLIKQRPNDWGAYLNAALSRLWQGKLKEALNYFELANDFAAHEPAVNLYLGLTHKLMNKPQLAETQFQIAEKDYLSIMTNNPTDEQAVIELAYLYLYSGKKLGDVKDLLEKAEKIIESSDWREQRQIWIDFYLPHLKGVWLYKNGNHRESILMFADALQKVPSGIRLDLAEIYYYLGKNYQALNDDEKAYEFLNKALTLDPLVLYAADIRASLAVLKKTKQKSKL